MSVEKSFARLINHVFPRYRGVDIERRDGGYVWNRDFYPTKEDLDKAIDQHIDYLRASINRIPNVNNSDNSGGGGNTASFNRSE